ncbi:hypothetical protein SDJN02_13993, partial [Cucurbita argyrosperma subsp. argyrosperma]
MAGKRQYLPKPKPRGLDESSLRDEIRDMVCYHIRTNKLEKKLYEVEAKLHSLTSSYCDNASRAWLGYR